MSASRFLGHHIKAALLVGALLLAACGGGATDEPAGGDTRGAAKPSPAPEPTPLGKPDVVLKVKTPSGKRFMPEKLKAPAGSVVKIVYTNLSGLVHQFKIHAGTSPEAPILGTTRISDDSRPRSTIFQLPDERGRFFYYCPVLGHGLVMRGFLIAK